MRPALAALLLCCLMRCPAEAASFDCSAASGRIERMICADAALSLADSALGTGFAAALAASPHPQAVRAEQRQWIAASRDKAASPNALLAAYQSRTEELRQQGAGWQAIRQSVATAAPGTCLKLISDEGAACTVTEAGKIAGAPDPTLRYRLQTWHDGDTTTGTGVIVLAGEGADTRAVTWSADVDTYYEAPAILPTPRGTLLTLPGHISGTGNFSAETLFLWRDGSWREIDTSSWIDQLVARLPKGVGAWKGIYPDWRTMTARTALWRDGDANCCPHAGSATVTLRLDHERIVLVSLLVSSQPLPEE